MTNTTKTTKTKTPTIAFLRQSGWKVRVIHKRPKFITENIGGVKENFSPKGGETRIEITSPDKKIDAVGISYCASEDHFNRKMGNKIALGRAWKIALSTIENKIHV
jgi:hypothetical protein